MVAMVRCVFVAVVCAIVILNVVDARTNSKMSRAVLRTRGGMTVRGDDTFLKNLAALDAEKKGANAAKLESLRDQCYTHYQNGFVSNPDVKAYSESYKKEFTTAYNALSKNYDISSWGPAPVQNDLNKIIEECVTGTPGKPVLRTATCIPKADGTALAKDQCFMIYSDLSFNAVIDCKMYTEAFAKSVYPKRLGKVGDANKCEYMWHEVKYFISFYPKTPVKCPKGNIRVSVPLKDRTAKRPTHLFPILVALLNSKEVAGHLVYSKIETIPQRQDAILMQICYDPADVAGATKLLSSIEGVLSGEQKGFISSDDGPYLQKKTGVFFVADYTHGSSWGQDLCCMWSQLEDAESLQALVSAASHSSFAKLAPNVVNTRDRKSDCIVSFKPGSKLRLQGTDAVDQATKQAVKIA